MSERTESNRRVCPGHVAVRRQGQQWDNRVWRVLHLHGRATVKQDVIDQERDDYESVQGVYLQYCACILSPLILH